MKIVNTSNTNGMGFNDWIEQSYIEPVTVFCENSLMIIDKGTVTHVGISYYADTTMESFKGRSNVGGFGGDKS